MHMHVCILPWFVNACKEAITVPSADPRLKGCTWFRLRRASRRITQLYDGHLAPSGLTVSQYSLLSHLVGRPSLTICDLSVALGMDRTTLSRNLKPLLTRGLVQSAPGDDRRSKRLVPTAAGEAAWSQAKALWRQAQSEIQRRLGEDAVARLNALLDDAFAGLEASE